jgi:hypothetical protein
MAAKAKPQSASKDAITIQLADASTAGKADTALARRLNALRPTSSSDPTAYHNDPQQPPAPNSAPEGMSDALGGSYGATSSPGSSGGGNSVAGGGSASGLASPTPIGMGGWYGYGATPSSDSSSATSSSATGGSTSASAGSPSSSVSAGTTPSIGLSDPSSTPANGAPPSSSPTDNSPTVSNSPDTSAPPSGNPADNTPVVSNPPDTSTPPSGSPADNAPAVSNPPDTSTPPSSNPTDNTPIVSNPPDTSTPPSSDDPTPNSYLPTTDVSDNQSGGNGDNGGTSQSEGTPPSSGGNNGAPVFVADDSSPPTGNNNSGTTTNTSPGGGNSGGSSGPSIGRAPGNPFLPSSYDGKSYLLSIDSCISASCESNGWEFFDPPTTTGLDFHLVENPPGAPLTFGIVGIQVPTIVGDGVYQLLLCQASNGDCDISTGVDITANGGDTSADIFDVTSYLESLETTDPALLAEIGVTDPADGISAFGLEGLGGANLDDPDAFVAGLLFTGTVDGSLLITPEVTDGDISYSLPPIDPPLPEPSSAAALLSGLAVLIGWKRRRGKRRAS